MTVHLDEVTLNLTVHPRHNYLQAEGRVEHALVHFVHSTAPQRNQFLNLNKYFVTPPSTVRAFKCSSTEFHDDMVVKLGPQAKVMSFSGAVYFRVMMSALSFILV
jgi:hypothetical protein